MREKLITKLGILGLAAIFLLSMASYSTDQEVTTQGKPEKPFKPGKPEKEWIAFSGHLVGGQVVEGCCPKRGPSPEYTMTLPNGLGLDPSGKYEIPPGIHLGYLFINGVGAAKQDRQYKVQFWNYEFGIEIVGGVLNFDKKTKILTVTFTEELCVDMWSGRPITSVTFTLVRHQY